LHHKASQPLQPPHRLPPPASPVVVTPLGIELQPGLALPPPPIAMPDGDGQALQPARRGPPRGPPPRFLQRGAAGELAEPADVGLEPIQLGEEVPVLHVVVVGRPARVELGPVGVAPWWAAEVPAVQRVETDGELGGLGVHAAAGEEQVSVDAGGVLEPRAVVVGRFLQGEGLVVVGAERILVDEKAEFRRQDGKEGAGELRVYGLCRR
ncbi:MAG: hypothetical protein Q9214_007687, partial [Letrouitia sp. 1 TL-2023]